MFKVFEVDDCMESYAMSVRLIGAKDRNDLIMHLQDILKTELEMPKRQSKQIIKEKGWRIREIENLSTSLPYKILYTSAYYE